MPTLEKFGCSLKVKYIPTIHSNHTTPRYLPREMKAFVHTKMCTQMFTAALRALAPNWGQPNYLTISE